MVKRKKHVRWIGWYVFIGLSCVWGLVALYGFFTFGWIGRFADLTPAELVVQVSSLFFPIGVFYLLANYIDRNQLARMEMASAKAYLDELIYPSEFGSQHIQELQAELKEQIKMFRGSFSEVSAQTEQVKENLTQWIDDLNKIIEHMDEQTRNMSGYVQQLEEVTEAANQKSSEAGNNLVAQAEILLKVTDETQQQLQQTTKQLSTQTEEINQNVYAITQAEKNINESLDTSAKWVKYLSENAVHIEKSMKKTDDMQRFLSDTDKVLLRFKEIGTTLDLRLKALKQTPEAEKNIKSESPVAFFSAKEFTERMQQLLDKLQDISIEMGSIFEIKNEESLWNQYYSGDKSIFMRYIKGVLNQTKYQKMMNSVDDEFRSNALSYMKTFEDLTRGLENSPWLGVLVGSDPGRLYMVLATLFKGDKNASKTG